MSAAIAPGSSETPIVGPAPAPAGVDAPSPPRRRSPWIWTTLACALLVASGLVRNWQARYQDLPSLKVGKPPFALRSLATSLGNWKILEGSERRLDPEVAQVSGCTDHLLRDYYDTETGCVVTVLIGYGPADLVYGHSPEVCFPAAGYRQVGEPMDSQIAWAEAKGSSHFRSGIFEQGAAAGVAPLRLEAYYSLRHAGKWSPDVNFKSFRKQPEMYRIMIERRVLETERRDKGNPTEKFLAEVVPEIERRIAQAGPAR